MEPFEAKFNGVEIVAQAKSLHISFSYFTATGERKKENALNKTYRILRWRKNHIKNVINISI